MAYVRGAQVAAAMPGSLKALPEPESVRLVGLAAGALLLMASFLGPLGVLALGGSAVARLMNLYGLALACLTVILEAEVVHFETARGLVLSQARFLEGLAGRAGLHLSQGLMAVSQCSVGYVLAGLVAIAAGGLGLWAWWAQRSLTAEDRGTALDDMRQPQAPGYEPPSGPARGHGAFAA